MADPPKTNPAGRLYHLLKQAHPKNGKRTFGEVWADVFGIDPEDRGRLLTMLAHMLHQIDEGRKVVEQNPELRQDLHLKPFEKLEKAFSKINVDAQWKSWKRSQLPDETLTDLEWCAESLKGVYPEGEIDRAKLAELREEVEKLIEEVREADIPEDLKAVIIDGLEHVRSAILEYDLRGVDGLKRALEQNLGVIYLHQRALRENPDVWEFVKKWAGRLAALKILVDTAYVTYDKLPPGAEEAIQGLITGAGG